MKKYLIDESIFVYLDRKDYPLKTKLISFLEEGRATRFLKELVRDSNVTRKHVFYMPVQARVRLKDYYLLKTVLRWKRIFGGSPEQLNPLEKANYRVEISKAYVQAYKSLGVLSKLKTWFLPKELSDLYVFANEEKSKKLQKTKKRKLKANEIIPISTCEIAMIAHKHELELVSFNEDHEFFQLLPNRSKPYIKYHHPDELLKNR